MKRLALLLLFAATAHAGDPLINGLRDSATQLKSGDYAKALKTDERLIDSMIDRLGPGDAESKWFSVAVAHKALALAGLGREDDAIWYWHVAVNLYPAIAESDMSMFGKPAEFLKQHPLAPPALHLPHVSGGPPPPGVVAPMPMPAGSIQAPRILRRVEPLYPRAARSFGVSGIAIFEMRIDKTGSIRDVTMLKGLPAPTLSYCAMEALRQWKFEPGTLDGQPVDVLYNLTVNYKLRY